MSLDAYGHKQTNQILDFDERHCINEYKSAYVLTCRSTINRHNNKHKVKQNKDIHRSVRRKHRHKHKHKHKTTSI